MASRIEQIDRCLPQTQCTRCGYPSCRDYAVALDSGEAEINQCPPGGDVTIAQLSVVLNTPIKALNTQTHGNATPRQVVKIIEEECIGCTVCIKACPVDAIIGAHKLMHSIITDQCTGCELCIAPCPMDCIDIVQWDDSIDADDTPSDWPGYAQSTVEASRKRYQKRQAREDQPKENQLIARKTTMDERKSMIAQILNKKP